MRISTNTDIEVWSINKEKMTQNNDNVSDNDKSNELKRSALKDLSDFGIVLLAVGALSCLGYVIDMYKHKEDKKPNLIQKGWLPESVKIKRNDGNQNYHASN